MPDTLNFAETRRHDHNIIEVIPHDDIEINIKDMDDLQALINNNADPVLLLINRRNEYSYSFDAIRAIRSLENVKALALLFNNLTESYGARIIQGEKDKCHYPSETFLDKQDALEWLNSLNK